MNGWLVMNGITIVTIFGNDNWAQQCHPYYYEQSFQSNDEMTTNNEQRTTNNVPSSADTNMLLERDSNTDDT